MELIILGWGLLNYISFFLFNSLTQKQKTTVSMQAYIAARDVSTYQTFFNISLG